MEKESFSLIIFPHNEKTHKQKTAKQISNTCPHKHRPEKTNFRRMSFQEKNIKIRFYNFEKYFSTAGKRNVSIYRE